jgi:hypothetical protein
LMILYDRWNKPVCVFFKIRFHDFMDEFIWPKKISKRSFRAHGNTPVL